MAINGSDLITRLQKMVKIEQHRRQRAFAATFSDVVRSRMEELGRGHLAGDAFDEIRKWKRDESLVRLDVANVGEKARRNMPHAIPEDVLRVLYHENIDLFETLQSELNSLRSKTTHVSAVFRPFQQRYIDMWSDSVVDFRKSQFLDRAEELNSRPITDLVSFKIWADDVYSLFRDSAVFDPTEMTLKTPDPDNRLQDRQRIALPMGMIRSGSERIYGQQWRLWVRESEEEIADFIDSTSPDSKRKYAAISAAIAQTRLPAISEPLQLAVPGPISTPTLQSEIELIVTPVNDATLAASQTWGTKAIALREIGEFIEALKDAWGAGDDHVRCTVKFGNGVVPLKPLTLDEASDFLRAFLEKRA